MDLSTTPPTNTWTLKPQVPSFAYTCKTFYRDACSIYFSQNTFIWHCNIDDYDEREFPLEQLQILKTRFSKHARHLQHFTFTIEYVVQDHHHGLRRARYQMRSHRDKDGRIECEKWFVGRPRGGGLFTEVEVKVCGCDLVGRCVEGERKGLDLLGFAECVFRGEPYQASRSNCDNCGLEKIATV